MREELEKECRAVFRRMITVEFPDYLEDKAQAVKKNRCIRTWQHPCGVWFHLILMIHPTRDKFTVEAAWDFDGKLGPLQIVAQEEMEEIFERPILFRMNFFWSGKDYWWPLVLCPEELANNIFYKDDPLEDCFPLVAPAMQDATKKIKEHLLPIFEKIMRLRGHRQAGDMDVGYSAA